MTLFLEDRGEIVQLAEQITVRDREFLRTKWGERLELGQDKGKSEMGEKVRGSNLLEQWSEIGRAAGSNTLPPQPAQPEPEFAQPAAEARDDSQHWVTASPYDSEQVTADSSVAGERLAEEQNTLDETASRAQVQTASHTHGVAVAEQVQHLQRELYEIRMSLLVGQMRCFGDAGGFAECENPSEDSRTGIRGMGL